MMMVVMMMMVGMVVVAVVTVVMMVMMVVMVRRSDVDLSQLHATLACRLGRGLCILGVEKGASVRDRT